MKRASSDIDLAELTRLFRKRKLEPLRFSFAGSNGYQHAIVYLGSYLHDAEFTQVMFDQAQNTLQIQLKRCCWEYFTWLDKHRKALPAAHSLLRIDSVTGYKFVGAGRRRCNYVINSIYLGPETFEGQDKGVVVITNPHEHWRLLIETSEDRPAISLRDITKPVV